MEMRSTGFRFSERELDELDQLAEQLGCSRTTVVRHAVAALRDDPQARRQIQADYEARELLRRLRERHGWGALLSLDPAAPDGCTIAGRAPDPALLRTKVRHSDDRFALDLVDANTGTQIINVITWTADAVHHHVVALRDLWVHSSVAAIDDPQVRQLPDGRPIVQVPGPDGARRYLALNADGTTSPLDLSLLPRAHAAGAELSD